MNMQAALSAGTAFCISGGGSLLVVLVGGEPTKWQIVSAVILGVISSAKDLRALYKLPPVGAEEKENKQ